VTKTIERLFDAIEEEKAKRVCIQALNYPQMIEDVTALISKIRECRKTRVSVSCQPRNKSNIIRLKESGIERIGIPLDASTKDLFDRIKGGSAGGPYTWEEQLRLLREATAVFGKGNVSTHLIVGLGETEKDLVRIIQRCHDAGVLPGLFAFTPILGTILEHSQPPSLDAYRRIQLARLLIVEERTAFKNFIFDRDGKIACFGVQPEELAKTIHEGEAFRTSGCPDCNRPYYNERPSGPVYNYPRTLTDEEVASIRWQFKSHAS